MTPRERALKEFHKRWKKDAESDGEELPTDKQLDNAFLEGLDEGRKSVANELKAWAGTRTKIYRPETSSYTFWDAVVAKCDDLES